MEELGHTGTWSVLNKFRPLSSSVCFRADLNPPQRSENNKLVCGDEVAVGGAAGIAVGLPSVWPVPLHRDFV